MPIYMVSSKNVKYLIFGGSDGSSSLTEILEVEYLKKGVR